MSDVLEWRVHNLTDSDKEFFSRKPLSERELKIIFSTTDWAIIDNEPLMEETYNDFSSVSLCKTHLLPYLLPLTSERPLARELREREFLQVLCGFSEVGEKEPNRLPSRSTLWYFREKYKEIFSRVMLKLLVSIAVLAKDLKIILPYAQVIEAPNRHTEGICISFNLKSVFVILWMTIKSISNVPSSVRQLTLPLDSIESITSSSRQRTKLANSLGLPTEAIVQPHNSTQKPFLLVLSPPSWLLDHSRLGKDTLTTIGPANITRPYTACKILLIKKVEDREYILLSQRLTGFGEGQFELPGGKRSPNDSSIEASAYRELKEETGLELITSRPVSLRNNNYPGRPPVKSLGVIALEYEGKLTHKESNQNTPWDWYDLHNLPSPLFDPSRKAIDDYLNNAFPDLTWNDVEDPEHQPTLFDLEQF